MRNKINIKKTYDWRVNGEIEKNNNFSKRAKKKIINQNNVDQIGKYNTINLDWIMKLKTNKTFIK